MPARPTAQALAGEPLVEPLDLLGGDARQVDVAEVLDGAPQAQLLALEPRLRHGLASLSVDLRRLGDEVVPCKRGERRPPLQAVQHAAAPERVELPDPAREQVLRDRRVRRRPLLARRDERLPLPAHVGVVPQVRVGATHAPAVPPIEFWSRAHDGSSPSVRVSRCAATKAFSRSTAAAFATIARRTSGTSSSGMLAPSSTPRRSRSRAARSVGIRRKSLRRACHRAATAAATPVSTRSPSPKT